MNNLLAYLICCVGVFSLIAQRAACETMYFQPTNIEQPSQFQTMELRFVGWSTLDGDPTVQSGDFMYVIDSTATSCAITAPSSENRFSVVANTAQNVATVVLVASPTVFTVGSSYAACYVSSARNEAFVVLRQTIDQGVLVEVPFTATAAIYQSMSISPTTVYAGQGLITVVITEDDQRSNGRPLNQGGLGGVRPFLLACGTSCGSYAALASMCSSATGVTLSSIDGYTTVTLTGTFTAPLQPAAGYALCVPYCYSSSAGCSQDGYTMAWTVVTSATVTFQAADPSSYFMDPINPTVRMTGSANVTGTGLTTNDRVKIIAAGSSCSSPNAALMSNVNYNQAVVWKSSAAVAVPFTSLSLITSSISGQLCYARGANPTIFAPVFLTGSSVSDFVINPMHPTQFSVDPPAPSLGQSFSITFTGADLSASADSAYLVTSSSSSCSVTASSDLCDGTTTNPTYACALSGGSTPSCIVAVDPDTNSAATLCACYRLPRSNNYGMVNGSISLSARNPIYTLSPYPVYEGQEATMTFSGSGISSADTVRFVAAHDSCDGIPVTNITAYNGQSNSSTSAVFNIVGPGSLCLRVCYRFSSSSTWVTSRPTTAISVDASCPSTRLYISPFIMRYTLSPNSVYARATISATFSGSATTPVAFKVVPAVTGCVISNNCGSGPACVQAALAADYFSSVSSSAATFAITRSGDQVLCVSLGSSFIPVMGATTGAYTFTSVPENPSSFATSPALWRVGMSNLSASFAGTALNVTSASNDILRALDNATLLSSKGVCPVEASSVSVILTSTATASSGTTAVTFALRGADTLVASTSVHLCYYRGASGSRIASYLGAVVVGGQNPASMTATGSLRAGEVVSLLFNASATASLFPSTDTLLFFQFQQSSIAPTCRCDATSCATAISNTTSTIVMSGSSSLSTWRSPVGFDNLAASAVYVVCYTVASSGSPTYVGQLPIAQSHPSYYTLGSTAIRVGLPVVITVATLCTTCAALSSMDDIIIVQNITHCADVSSMNASQAEGVSPVSYTAPTTQRSLVPLQEGFYRVCYKKHNTSQYQELAFSSQFTRTTLTVTRADPASFAPIPASPTAGQYMIINLTSCTAAVCGTCSALRIVRGTGASCWNTSLTAYASQSCVGTSTVYQFPNQFFTAGPYTVCFGDSAISRVPGSLTIAAANPSHYTAVSTSVFTNQGSKATLTLFGSALSATDSVFLLPNVSYSCHDLRDPQLDIRQNATFAGWWNPSVDAYPIILTSSSVATWVASDSSKRFSQDIISSSKFCSSVNSKCGLQLCYLRAGTSWAPVSMQTSTTVSLFPANPQRVVFDVSSTPRVTQYVLATVTGTGLTTSDTLYLSDGFCDQGVVLARTVSAATTNGTTWRGVIRFTSRNSGTVSACYTSGVTTTQILDAPIIFSIAAPLYYVKQPTWNESQRIDAAGHTLTQYESVYIAGTTSSTGSSQIVNVASMYVVSQADECYYEAFPFMTLAMQNPFERVLNQTSYFLGRLYRSGSFALCLNTSGLLFRIVGSSTNNSATSIVVQSPNPSAYVLNPVTPFVDQSFTVTFQFGASGVFEQQNVTGDSVHLIQGGLQSCGFSNVSTEVVSLGAGGVATHIISSANVASNWTVCYRTYNGSFATVPRNGLADRNFKLATRYPRYFSTRPQQPQTTVSLNISFYSNSTGPLSTGDRAYLVLKDNSSAVPSPLDCTRAPALSADAISVTGTTSTWSISSSSNQLQPGTYSVCYVVASNGKGSIVDLSGYLVIVPRQSPYGIATDSIGGLSIYSGERARVFFLSSVVLTPAISWTANASHDQVVISSSPLCTPTIGTGAVDPIPTTFMYNNSAVSRNESFVHLRFRQAGVFFVCMRRTGRTPNQQFYDFDAIGGPDTPIAITVSAAPMQSLTLSPGTPRVAVPHVLLLPTYGTGFTAASFTSVFAVPYDNATVSDSLTNDACYFPPQSEALGSLVLNTTLRFFVNMSAAHPFPQPGRYRLCYALPQRNVASLPLPFVVGAMSPIHYSVPDLIAPGTSFVMTVTSTDLIFASAGNVATIVSYSGGTPSCDTFTGATGTSNFTSFSGTQNVSTVQPLLTQQGTYFLCFKTFDQVRFFPVPNALGGYIFGVGDVGPTQYAVSPTPRYSGQLLTLSIQGNALRAADTAKIVNVTGVSSQGSTYFAICAATSPAPTDVNALNVNAASGAGLNITFTSSSIVSLQARIMRGGTYILCYQGATNAWAYVPDVASFSVGSALPSSFVTFPSTPFVTQLTTLSIRSVAGGMNMADDVKLVLRGGAPTGFDCVDDAAASLTYSNVTFSGSERNVSFCSQTAASYTVCYRLTGGTWAEVPSSSGGYAPLVVASLPLVISSVTVSAIPRPLEPFQLSFTTTASGTGISSIHQVQYVNVSTYTICSANSAVPTLFSIVAGLSGRAAHRASGQYRVLVGLREGEPLLTLQTLLTIGSCDPCTFSPQVLFTGTSYNLSFASISSTLSNTDAVRLVPTAVGLSTANLCSSSAGSFGSVTFPSSGTPQRVQVLVAVPQASAGLYYVCYRKNTTDFAVVGSSFGVAEVLRIIDPEPQAFTRCPAIQLFAGQGVTFTFTTAQPELAPLSSHDSVFLVDSAASCSASATMFLAAFASNSSTQGAFDIVLPSSATDVAYRVCYKHQLDTTSRSIGSVSVSAHDPSMFVTQPTNITVGLSNGNITLFGSSLSALDDVYFVSNTTTCEEYCRAMPIAIPSVGPSFQVDTSELPLLLTVRLNGSFTTTGTVNVCYRRNGGTLAKLPQALVIAPANPSTFTTNFRTRFRTRPTFNFTGTSLSAADSVKIVAQGAPCASTTSTVTGTFVSAHSAGQWSSFLVPLNEPISIGVFTVCYNRVGTGWVPVAPALIVQPGGPLFFNSTNVPMAGRAVDLWFPSQDFASYFGVGDQVRVVCGTCSCWTSTALSVPYGVTDLTVTSISLKTVLRVGFGGAQNVLVCYRVGDSGFGLVASMAISGAFPTTVVHSPTPPLRGQRVSLTLSGIYTSYSAGDQVMLTSPSRGCWDNVLTNPSQVYSIGNITSWSTTQGAGVVHIPSLGPTASVFQEAFPLNVTACFRAAGQPEFVFVPFPANEHFSVLQSNPSTITTTPSIVREGMINVSVVFGSSSVASEDVAYAVSGVWGDRICDAGPTSVAVANARGARNFTFTALRSDGLILEGRNVTYCVTKHNGTVAEVPQQTVILPRNPAAYVLNTTSPRNREYVLVTLLGSSLTTAVRLVLTMVPCVYGVNDPSTVVSGRVADATGSGASVSMTVHILGPASTFNAYVCVYAFGAWTDLGMFAVAAANPSLFTIVPTTPRGGQHVSVTLSYPSLFNLTHAAILWTTGPQSWCTNFTSAAEPALLIDRANVKISSNVFLPYGSLRICVYSDTFNLWRDVDDSPFNVSAVQVLPPNPSARWAYPQLSRVGQQVTLYFSLLVPPAAGDRVAILNSSEPAVASMPCDDASVLAQQRPITGWNATTSFIVVHDASDVLMYRSFNATMTARICYFAASDGTWNAPGGTVPSSTLIVAEMSPFKWSLVSGALVVQKAATIGFTGISGSMGPLDHAFLVPMGVSCANRSCSGCIDVPLDTTTLNSTYIASQVFSPQLDGNYSVCYILADATSSMVPGDLEIATGDIQCVQESQVHIGRRQNVTFRVLPNVNTTLDAFQVSVWATTTGLCNNSVLPDFPQARASRVGSTVTTVTFSLEWPVTLNSSRYSICYKHLGESGRVCSCSQFDSRSSECFITTLAAAPGPFVTVPRPSYVGQLVAITIHQAASTAIINDVALVLFADTNLSTCRDAKSPVFLSSAITMRTSTATVFQFKHDYRSGAARFIVCALMSGMTEFARVPTYDDPFSTLMVRPFLQMTTLPTAALHLRAHVTLQLATTHMSREADDVLSTMDVFTLVQDPLRCNESAIDGNASHSASVMGAIESSDSTIKIGGVAPVQGLSNSSTFSFVTFATAGTWYVCYRLSGATWAVVDHRLDILSPAWDSCSTAPIASPANNDAGHLRAFQYFPFTLEGASSVFTSVQTPFDDMHLVMAADPCYNESLSLFSPSRPFSLSTAYPTAVAWSPRSGSVKLCYRIGGSSNTSFFSPVCVVALNASSPSASTSSSCLLTGETMSINVSSSNPLQLSPSDTIWFTEGQHCYFSNGTSASPTRQVFLNFSATQTYFKPPQSSTSAMLAPLTLANARQLRACYTNAFGSYFAIPLNNEFWGVISIAERQPQVSIIPEHRLHVGQIPPVEFVARTGAPLLSGGNGSVLPVRPAIESTDAAGVAAKLASISEGSCAFVIPSMYQVTMVNSTRTRSVLLLASSGMHTPCYRTSHCGVVDVPSTFRVYEANPASMTLMPVPARKGQLLNLTFMRAANETDALFLSPGGDRAGAVDSSVQQCWQLSPSGGRIVSGTSQSTWVQSIIYADAPALAAPTTVLGCYSLLQSPIWATVPNSGRTIYPANPQYFTTAFTPMAYQQIQMTFVGANFTSGDRAKIIPLSLNCSDMSAPPLSISSFGPDVAQPTTTADHNGWRIDLVNSNTSRLNISSSTSGTFSVCYRLSSDTVWTLVYANLVIQPRNPEIAVYTPASALESEIFTVAFSRSNYSFETSLEMAPSDRLELIAGEGANCMVTRYADIISTAPSRSDLLPNYTFFQMASATRGTFTLCYVRWAGGMRLPTWGFPSVIIQPNPTSFFTHTTTPSASEYVGIVFRGFGLQSINGRVDSVKLIAASEAQTDLSCRTVAQATNVIMGDFRAFGNYSIQTVIALEATHVWVCYKLYGGQYHVLPSSISFAPQRLTLADQLKTGAVDGEQLAVNISYVSTGWRQGDYIFLSSYNCTDIPVSLGTATDVSSNFDASSSLSQVGGFAVGALRSRAAGTFAVCYRSPRTPTGGITIVVQWSVIIGSGVPAAIPGQLPFTAQRFVNLAIPWVESLSVSGRYITIVASTGACVGLTPPTSAAYAESTSWNTTHAMITGVLPASGTYYLCSSFPIAPCGLGSRECGRIVATLAVGPATPLGWISIPAAEAFSTLEQIRLQFFTSSVPSTATLVFLRSMTTITPLTSATVLPCVNSSATTVVLRATTVTYSGILPAPGNYAVCIAIEGTTAVFPSQYIAVSGSTLTRITLSSPDPSVGDTIVLQAEGRGLTSNDTLRLVRLPLQDAYTTSVLLAACANSSAAYVSATPESEAFAAAFITFLSTTLVSAKYASCYRFSYSTQWHVGNVVVVAPVVTGVRFTSQPLYVLSAFGVTLVGVSLSHGDQIGFAQSERGCFFDSIAYFALQNINGTTDLGTGLTISSPGAYVACFRSAVATIQQLAPLLSVIPRNVVAAQFVLQPQCSEDAICSQQPSVVMLDGGGNTLGEIGATISLTLDDTDGRNRNDALAGNRTYSYLSTGRFDFFSVSIRSAGMFKMTATVLLLGGATLVALTGTITVPVNSTLRTLSLSCSPEMLLRGSSNGIVTCVVAASTNNTASAFSIQASTGTVSSVQQTYASGLPQYAFTVTASMANYSLHFVLITVLSADSRYPGRIVENSPAIIRIASVPDNSSLLVCSSTVSFNSIPYVRAVGTVSCALQGRARVDGTTFDVIAPSSYFVVESGVDGMDSPVALPAVPQGVGVAYTFTAGPLSTGALFVVSARVSVLATLHPVIGSPASFIILRSPTASVLRCTTSLAGLAEFFLPGESIACTVTLQDTNGPAPTPTFDLHPTIDVGTVQNISGTELVSTATFSASAPVGNGGYVIGERRFLSLSTAQDQTFTVRLVYTPTGQVVALSHGTLVLVTNVRGHENLIAGYDAAILLSGSGLSLTHMYSISPFASCNNSGLSTPGVSTRSSTVAGDIVLGFTVPSYPFYVCFARSTADTPRPLLQGAFRNITVISASGGLEGDDLILIIVACILFCLLLLMLPLVLWRLRSKALNPVLVYAPRVNDQYIHRPVVSTPIATPTPGASTPRGSQQLHTPPPGGFKDEMGFAPVLIVDARDETGSARGPDKKKKRKKVDASLKKIAVMQQHELDARFSEQGSDVADEQTPTMPPPQPAMQITSFPQPVQVVTVEERHTTHMSTGHQAYPPPHYGGFGETTDPNPHTTTARPFTVFGHTSHQFATD